MSCAFMRNTVWIVYKSPGYLEVNPVGRVGPAKNFFRIAVDIDEDTLGKISARTGGKYFRADNAENLKKIYAEIDRLEKTDFEVKKFRQYEELFAWVILAGLFVLVLEIILSQTVWRKLP